MSARWDTAVSAGAWDDLAARYEAAGREDADDETLAAMVRQKMQEVEG